jgi:hypothetical protein
MSKNLLILSLFILSVLKLNAQCTPDGSITKPGFYPSSLPEANVGLAYSEVINFKIIKDTTIIVFGNPAAVTIDSATIVKVNGMPDGLTFQLNKPRKTYTPAETGCASISGIPTKGGTFKLQIILKVYAKIGSFGTTQADTIDNFVIVVKETADIPELANQTNLIYPNPLTADKLSINTNLVKPGSVISIYNYQGQPISTSVFNSESLAFDYPKGLYYISFSNGEKVSRIKLVKQ